MREQFQEHSAPSPWHTAIKPCLASVPAAVRPWIRLTTSMTRQLRQHYAADVAVRVLRDSPGPLIPDEMHLFSPRQDRGHVRKVVLHCGTRPLIAARTVFISRSLRNNAEIAGLGSRPLGELLFTHGKAHWVMREYAKLIPIPFHNVTIAASRLAHWRVHRERMAPGICVKAFHAWQQASTICSYPYMDAPGLPSFQSVLT